MSCEGWLYISEGHYLEWGVNIARYVHQHTGYIQYVTCTGILFRQNPIPLPTNCQHTIHPPQWLSFSLFNDCQHPISIPYDCQHTILLLQWLPAYHFPSLMSASIPFTLPKGWQHTIHPPQWLSAYHSPPNGCQHTIPSPMAGCQHTIPLPNGCQHTIHPNDCHYSIPFPNDNKCHFY